jgi:hypothetical protein
MDPYLRRPTAGIAEQFRSSEVTVAIREETMRAYVVAIATAALFAVPTSAFSQVDVEVGPGGVYVGPRYHRDHDDRGYQGDRHYGGGRCRELRQACLHKEELGEQGMGNCRRYREMCR